MSSIAYTPPCLQTLKNTSKSSAVWHKRDRAWPAMNWLLRKARTQPLATAGVSRVSLRNNSAIFISAKKELTWIGFYKAGAKVQPLCAISRILRRLIHCSHSSGVFLRVYSERKMVLKNDRPYLVHSQMFQILKSSSSNPQSFDYIRICACNHPHFTNHPSI